MIEEPVSVEELRDQVAYWAGEAQRQSDIADEMQHVADDPQLPAMAAGSAQQFAQMARTTAYRAATMQHLMAQVAVAHDVMMAAGGPDNPVALAEYVETAQTSLALMPSRDVWFNGPSLDG